MIKTNKLNDITRMRDKYSKSTLHNSKIDSAKRTDDQRRESMNIDELSYSDQPLKQNNTEANTNRNPFKMATSLPKIKIKNNDIL
jgi:hypothetical protein